MYYEQHLIKLKHVNIEKRNTLALWAFLLYTSFFLFSFFSFWWRQNGDMWTGTYRYHTDASLFSSLFDANINYLHSHINISSIYILFYCSDIDHAFNCKTYVKWMICFTVIKFLSLHVCVCVCVCVRARARSQSCSTLCDPMDCIACQAPLSIEFSGQE